jgi:N-acetylneuraminic acid mutarotase
VVSYQGRVSVTSAPYSGTGYFKFAIVNPAGDTTYWSNDGSSSDGGQPTNGTPLPVSSGLFNVLLGDSSLTNMTQPLTPSVFSGTNRYLRVWFSSDNINFQQLSPDRRIAAVPYALQAQQAADADTLDGQQAGDFASVGHDHPGFLPSGALTLSRSENDTTLIEAGYSYTGVAFEPGWFPKAEMPTGRRYLAATAVDGLIYAIGGSSSSNGNGHETANEAYDPVTDSWSAKAPMPTGRWSLAAAAVDGVIYAIGGVSSATNYETANEAYDPATDSWTAKAPLPTGRRNLAAAAVDGVLYAIGGESDSIAYETANHAYDPVADAWSVKAPLPTGRFNLAAAAVDGLIYAIGGYSGDYETTNEAYDPDANTWSSKADIPTGRHGLTAAAVDGVIYAIGGYSGEMETANEAYDPGSDSWSTKDPMPTGRFKPAAAALQDAIYVIGGETLAISNETANEAYTPALYLYSKD